ncbi:MAG TPA: phosphoribosyltransferase family protein [Thermoanaerobaculia bacterium]|nr:phosphoribosyltransferase family protein [Thermoanaerobaculia bacterium]
MLSALSSLGRETARIVLHASCVVCGCELPWRARRGSCCESCWSTLPVIRSAKCDSCAEPLPGVRSWEPGVEETIERSTPDSSLPAPVHCIRCIDDPLPVAWTDAWGHYRGSLERVLHAFKFEKHDFLDDALAALLEDVIRSRGDLDFDGIVAVPMHRAKRRHRGYNQADLLARALARRLRMCCDPSLLCKRADCAVQSTLPRSERAKNVRGAFVASSRARGRSLLLVDDICTTAETLRACARSLDAAGAARICAVVVAKA